MICWNLDVWRGRAGAAAVVLGLVMGSTAAAAPERGSAPTLDVAPLHRGGAAEAADYTAVGGSRLLGALGEAGSGVGFVVPEGPVVAEAGAAPGGVGGTGFEGGAVAAVLTRGQPHGVAAADAAAVRVRLDVLPGAATEADASEPVPAPTPAAATGGLTLLGLLALHRVHARRRRGLRGVGGVGSRGVGLGTPPRLR